jgi:hypothetical protein
MRKCSFAMQRLVGYKAPHGVEDDEPSVLAKYPTTTTQTWCHKGSECTTCPHLTHAIQALSTTLEEMSTNYMTHATGNLTPMLEQMADWTDQMDERSQFILQLHEEAAKLSRNLASTAVRAFVWIFDCQGQEAQGLPTALRPAHMMARLATVFNTTHAEMDHWFHQERIKEWSDMIERWVDGEIDMLEHNLDMMRGCAAVVKRSISEMRTGSQPVSSPIRATVDQHQDDIIISQQEEQEE